MPRRRFELLAELLFYRPAASAAFSGAAAHSLAFIDIFYHFRRDLSTNKINVVYSIKKYNIDRFYITSYNKINKRIKLIYMINKKSLSNKIKFLRESGKFSQEDLAKKVGLSRVAISQIEQGNRGIDFLELVKIAGVFKLKIDYFLIEDELPNIKLDSHTKTESDFRPEKLRNIILYILEKCAGKPNVGETVLYKLLYFIDFDNFEINNESISGLSYVHLQYGPVPVASQYLSVIEKMKDNQELRVITQDYYGLKIKRYINLIAYDINSLTPKETKVIDDVVCTLSNMSAAQIEEYSHGDAPWKLTKERELISYSLVFERQTPYAKKETDDLRYFKITSAKDVLKELGPISKKEYDYYENL